MATKESHRAIDRDQIEKKLREFGAANKCPISGHAEWTIVEEFVSVVPWEDGFKFGGTYPAVMLACNGCGYMALFSAIVLGLVEPDEVSSDE